MAHTVVVHPISPDIVAEAASGENRPHRHDYQEIIVLSAGRSVHEIDGQEMSVNAPCALVVVQGRIHRIRLDEGTEGWVVRFGNEFVPATAAPLFSQFMGAAFIPLEHEGLFRSVAGIVSLLATATDCSNSDVRRHLLGALLAILLDENRRLAPGASVGSDDHVLFQRFLRQLDRHFATRKDVDFYASDLGLTPKRLGALCKAMFGKTTSRIIEERAVIEAKRLLVYGTEDVREIALAVGFPDHSYFSRLFRKATGLAPRDYRMLHSGT